MKLELLLVLAAAMLLPDLSDSRIFSICELRNKLQVAIPQIGQLQLAKIICEVKNMSNLNSSLVIVKGNRQPMSTKQPMTTLDATDGTEEPAAANTTRPTTTYTDYDNTSAAAFTSTASVNASEPVSANSSAPSGSSRHKRSPSDRKPESENEEKQEGDSEEEDRSHEKDSSSEEDSKKTNTWSLGSYGIFQLNDKEFCDSGYRWSKDRCHTNCSAFTDDDITDDITCFVGQNYWRRILDHVSRNCHNSAKTFFNQCN